MSEKGINQQIAEWLGWTGIKPDLRWRDDEDGYISYQALLGVDPNGLERWLPDWEHNTDACLAVLPSVATSGKCYDVSLFEQVSGKFTATIVEDTPPIGRTGRWEGAGATRSEALAKALLAYLQAQKQVAP